MGKYLQIKSESCTCFIQQAQVNSFQRRINLQLEPWRVNSSNNLIGIRLGTHYSNIYANLQVTLLKEAVRLGSSWYCICHNWGCDFYKQLKVIMSFLPFEKMFLYPTNATLEGPFWQEPRLSQGRILTAQASLTFNEFHNNFDPQKIEPFPILMPCMNWPSMYFWLSTYNFLANFKEPREVLVVFKFFFLSSIGI